jgi:hypothetical protein
MKTRCNSICLVVFLGALCIAVLFVQSGQAQLLQYSFPTIVKNIYDTNDFHGSISPTTIDPNVTGGSLFQYGGTPTSGPIAFKVDDTGHTGNPYLQTYRGNTSVNTSVSGGSPFTSSTASEAGNAFFALTVTANSGYVLDLTGLTLLGEAGGSSSPRGFAIQSSVGGLSTDDSTDILALYTYSDFRVWHNFSVDLTGNSYQNLSSVTFYVFAYANSVTASVEFDDITVNGSAVLVPEPSTLALLAVGALCGFFRFFSRAKGPLVNPALLNPNLFRTRFDPRGQAG